MKNIFTKNMLGNLKTGAYDILKRFPVAIVFVLFLSVSLFFVNHGSFIFSSETVITKSIFSSVIGLFLAVGLYIYSESKNYSNIKKNITQIFTLVYVGIFFYYFKPIDTDIESIVYFIIHIIGIFGIILIAPYSKNIWKQDGKQTIYYTYLYSIITTVLTSIILGTILLILGYIGIKTIDTLFDLSGYFSSTKIYGDWTIIALSLFTPLFALSKIPHKQEFTSNHFSENIFFTFLIKYIAIPFIYIYFIILYSYSIKVLTNFSEWPKGEVTWMVILFSIFGYATYVLSYIYEEKSSYIKNFRKYFPYVVFPQVFMLFYAIYLRINQYDLTINRYFVVIFGLWLILISTYYIFSKKKYLGNIVALLTLFTVIISIGPWSVYNLPETRQIERLKSNLVQANILQENTIVPLSNFKDIDSKLSKQIHDGIIYLCDIDNCNRIKNIFPKIYNDLLIKKQEEYKNYQEKNGLIYSSTKIPHKWEISNYITKTIKVNSYHNSNSVFDNIYFYSSEESRYPLDISNKNTLYTFASGNSNTNLNASYNKENSMMTLKNGDDIYLEFDFTEIKDKLLLQYEQTGVRELGKENMLYTLTKNEKEISIIFESINIDASVDNDGSNGSIRILGIIME